MKKSKNENVQKFLEEILILKEDQFTILQKLREIVFKIYPKTSERIMYGGIMFSLEEDFGGIFANKNHISFEFGNGFKMNDPKKILEGKGKFRRHIKIKTLSEIKTKEVSFYVEQAI